MVLVKGDASCGAGLGAPQHLWLPLLAEWSAPRLRRVVAMRDGLAAAGAEVRLDEIGIGRPISLLCVRTPHAGIEDSERWLLRLVKPWEDRGESWASDLYCVLHQRRPELVLWKGASAELELLKPRFAALRAQCHEDGLGAAYALVGADPCSILAYPRGVAEILNCLPGVKSSVEVSCNFHEWVGLDVASDPEEVAELRAFEEGLVARGFATCRYELPGPSAMVLTIHAGIRSLEELEAQLAHALCGVRDAWKSRYRPWSWSPSISVHRHAASEGWAVREWLERELAGPPVDALCSQGGDEVHLRVPVAFVDRALALLVARFGDRGSGGHPRDEQGTDIHHKA